MKYYAATAKYSLILERSQKILCFHAVDRQNDSGVSLYLEG